MKKRNIIAFAASMVMAASAFTGLTAFAAAPADAVGDNIVAKYNADASTETEKVIDLYYTTEGDLADGLSSYEFVVRFPAGTVTKIAYSGLIDGFDAPMVNNEQIAANWGKVVVAGTDLYTSDDNMVGQLKLTVPADVPTFDLTIDGIKLCATWDFVDVVSSDITLNIPGKQIDPPAPEPVVASTVATDPIVEDGVKYTPFTALLDKAIKRIGLEINGTEENVTDYVVGELPVISGGDFNLGVVVKSRDADQTVGALKFYFE